MTFANEKHLVMGHVDSTTLADVWKSDDWDDLRKSLKSKNYKKVCKNCFGTKKRTKSLQ